MTKEELIKEFYAMMQESDDKTIAELVTEALNAAAAQKRKDEDAEAKARAKQVAMTAELKGIVKTLVTWYNNFYNADVRLSDAELDRLVGEMIDAFEEGLANVAALTKVLTKPEEKSKKKSEDDAFSRFFKKYNL